MVATCYLLGVCTRRMEKLVEALGITALSKSQVSVMARELDWGYRPLAGEQVASFRAGRWTPARTRSWPPTRWSSKVCEGGRVVGVHALLATGVNADGHREILPRKRVVPPSLQVTSGEDGAGWLGFFRDLTARGLGSGVPPGSGYGHTGGSTSGCCSGGAWPCVSGSPCSVTVCCSRASTTVAGSCAGEPSSDAGNGVPLSSRDSGGRGVEPVIDSSSLL